MGETVQGCVRVDDEYEGLRLEGWTWMDDEIRWLPTRIGGPGETGARRHVLYDPSRKARRRNFQGATWPGRSRS